MHFTNYFILQFLTLKIISMFSNIAKVFNLIYIYIYKLHNNKMINTTKQIL